MCLVFSAMSGRIGFSGCTVYELQRPAVRRRDRGMASLLRRREPVYADVRRLQGKSGRNVAQSTWRYSVQTGFVGHVHRRGVSGERIEALKYILYKYARWALKREYKH